MGGEGAGGGEIGGHASRCRVCSASCGRRAACAVQRPPCGAGARTSRRPRSRQPALRAEFVGAVRERRGRRGIRAGDLVAAPQAHAQVRLPAREVSRTTKGSMAFRDVFEVDGKPVREPAGPDDEAVHVSRCTNAVRCAPGRSPRGRAATACSTSAPVNNPRRGDGVPAARVPDALPRSTSAGIEKELGPTIRTVRFRNSACRPSCDAAPTRTCCRAGCSGWTSRPAAS